MTAQQLKNSILQMAVQGKLVPQDPNDEPASVLLERIRAEKEQLIKEKKIKKEKNPSVIFRGADNLPYEKVGKNEPVCIADEVPFDIPDSWEWTRLGQVITLLSGTDFKPSEYNDRQCGIPYITGASSLSDSGVIENRWTETPRVIANRGDVLLVCKGSGYGKTVICDIEEAHIARQIMAIKNQHTLNMDYVRFFLQSCFDQIKAKGQGVIPGIDRSSVLSLLFPLPPLHEQKRIVAKLLEVIPIVDVYGTKERTLYEHNAEFPVQLKKSILQCAVQGRLVPQDPNDEPASILLERIRTEKQRLVKEGKIKKDKHESVIFRRDNSHYEKCDTKDIQIDDDLPFDLPSGWAWSRLRNLTSKIGAGSTPQGGRSVYVEKGVKFIRSQNVYDDGLRLGDIVYITEETNSKKLGSVVCPQDILLNITGGSIGRCAVVPEDFDIGNVNQHVMIIRLIKPDMRYWIHAVLTSPYIQNLIMDVQVGVSREGLSASKLMDFFIPVPPVNEQKRILTSVGKINKIINSAL
ncbi:TPA: hypothetical protein IV330_000266 [Enterococcus faecium]|nr:hypothetical protein [Enterococcus faecium]